MYRGVVSIFSDYLIDEAVSRVASVAQGGYVLRRKLTREEISYLKSAVDKAVRAVQLKKGRRVSDPSEARIRAWAKYDAKRREGGVSEAEKARKRRYYARHKERLREENRMRSRRTAAELDG